MIVEVQRLLTSPNSNCYIHLHLISQDIPSVFMTVHIVFLQNRLWCNSHMYSNIMYSFFPQTLTAELYLLRKVEIESYTKPKTVIIKGTQKEIKFHKYIL